MYCNTLHAVSWHKCEIKVTRTWRSHRKHHAKVSGNTWPKLWSEVPDPPAVLPVSEISAIFPSGDQVLTWYLFPGWGISGQLKETLSVCSYLQWLLSGASEYYRINLHMMSLHKQQHWPHRKTRVHTPVVRLLQADHNVNDIRHKEDDGCYLHVAIANPHKNSSYIYLPQDPIVPLALRHT